MPAAKKPPQQPSADEMENVSAVARAGGEAAAAAPSAEQARSDARAAMREEADRRDVKLSAEDIDQIATVSVDKMIEQFEARGAFDRAPEPVQAPAQAAPAPGDESSQSAVGAGEQAPQTPQKRTWAHKFMGQ
jgi:hypothetical protein